MSKKRKSKKNKRRNKVNTGRINKGPQSQFLEKAVELYHKGAMHNSLQMLLKISKHNSANQKGVVSHLKGIVLYNLGKFEDAIHAVKHALVLDPKNYEFLNTLALAFDKSGQPLMALRYLSQACAIDMGYIKTYKNMATILHQLERYDQSLICLNKALELDSTNFELLKQTAYNYYQLGDLTSASQYYEKALEQEGDHSVIWLAIGTLFQSKGDLEGANQCFIKAIVENSHNYSAYENYVHSGKISDNERKKIADRLKDFLATLPLSVSDKRHIYFTLGRVYHDLNDHDSAMQFYVKGNKAREKELRSNFSLARYEEQIKHFISVFDKLFFKKNCSFGSPSRQPVFVVGMPRSGTTLLEQIIASHSKGYGAGELSTIKKIVHTEFNALQQKKTFEYGLQTATREKIKHQVDYYFSQSKKHAPSNAVKIVDKFPHNLQFLWCIALLFPQAPVIHCRRDPRDTCLSCFVTNFSSGHGYKNDLFTLGSYYRIYEGLMEHWKRVIPNPILTVPYEELIENPEKHSKKIIEHIGLEWEPDCLTLRSKQHFSLTASNVQIRKGIYKSSVQRWKKYENHLQPLLDGLAMTLE
ncbi:MAG: sulfotransferase [Thermodesulfobacteriota bacterium]|nr:sulfotransferase [Thermodesulfobacteriota bacterium]